MSRAGVYHVSEWKSSVQQGVSDTRRVVLEGFAKANTGRHPYCIANEYLASKLGTRAGLPIPPGALVEAARPGELAWMSLSFGDSLPPVNPTALVDSLPEMATGVVVFDILIVNTDRHTQNLAYRPSKKRLEIFDHSHALFGPDSGKVLERLSRARDKLAVTGSWPHTNRQCLLNDVNDPQQLLGWAERFGRELTDESILEACEEVGELGIGPTEAECDRMAMFLLNRRDNLKGLMLDQKGEFKSIPPGDWGFV